MAGMLGASGLHYLLRSQSPGGKVADGPSGKWFDRIKILIYAATSLSILILAITGFWAALVRGESLSGYPLMLHCTAAPVFCMFLPASLVVWAERYKFGAGDWQKGRRNVGLRKINFWILMTAAIPVILSMVLSMLPLWGTVGQEFLYELHRYSTVILVMAAIGHTGLVR